MIKGDNHHMENNLSFNNKLPYDLALIGHPGRGMKGENTHTVTAGNILQHEACSNYFSTENCMHVWPRKLHQQLLRDPDILTFGQSNIQTCL